MDEAGRHLGPATGYCRSPAQQWSLVLGICSMAAGLVARKVPTQTKREFIGAGGARADPPVQAPATQSRSAPERRGWQKKSCPAAADSSQPECPPKRLAGLEAAAEPSLSLAAHLGRSNPSAFPDPLARFGNQILGSGQELPEGCSRQIHRLHPANATGTWNSSRNGSLRSNPKRWCQRQPRMERKIGDRLPPRSQPTHGQPGKTPAPNRRAFGEAILRN